jgi:integrase
MDMNEDLRGVIALVSDTGMRLAEVCRLERNDIVLDAPIPHIILQPNSARRLKTDGFYPDFTDSLIEYASALF